MYGYYFLAEMNWIDRDLGGKFITPIQLIQFIFCILITAVETFFFPNCSDWRVLVWMWFTYLIFLTLFWKVFKTKAKIRESNELKKSQ